jgi:subtilase family serine protease
MRSIVTTLGVVAGLGLASAAHADTDLGPSAATETVTASFVLKVRNSNALENYVAATQDPHSWQFHQFVSVNEFVNRFSPSDQDIHQIKQYLTAHGITVTEVYADHLLIKATGPASAFDAVFATDMHDYQQGNHRYHRPHHKPSVPALFRDLLYVVEGLDDSASSFHPHHIDGNRSLPFGQRTAVLPASGATATGVPGNYTVGDVANLYDINPLYAQHITGQGRTIGIATLANFDPADAYQYWSLIGLDVKPNRITQVHVDGGGVLSADAGTGETCLDVEQSGGLAPRAKMVVYDAPNTEAGFIDLFYKAASDNVVDTLSVSWGSSEAYYFEAIAGVDRTGNLEAFHQAFLESAAQGISMFASSGDDGAYDINGPGFSPFLTIDAPSNDPAITSAGGTTVPASLDFGGATPLVISHEQVWGWDYLVTYFEDAFDIDITDEVYPVGGGGGVSVYWSMPDYQRGVHGVQRSQPNQSVVYDAGDGAGPIDYLDLPAHFAGRNVPDVSLNADPETGYLLYSTTDGGLLAGYGGTSFVAPQLNGITALLGEVAGGRLGLVNPAMYRLHDHHGHSPAAIVDITSGDNWFYTGAPGYEPGAGLGVLDVANLAALVREDARH